MNPAFGRQSSWLPHTDIVISQSDQLIVQVDLSGVQKPDLEITVDGTKLTIKGLRRNAEVASAKTILVNEIPAGPFESVMELPPGFNLQLARSTYANGVLRILVPRQASS